MRDKTTCSIFHASAQREARVFVVTNPMTQTDATDRLKSALRARSDRASQEASQHSPTQVVATPIVAAMATRLLTPVGENWSCMVTAKMLYPIAKTANPPTRIHSAATRLGDRSRSLRSV
jgi:hypothetical protein